MNKAQKKVNWKFSKNWIATVAQLVEQLICNQSVGGSSPLGGSVIKLKFWSRLLTIGGDARAAKGSRL